MGVFIMQSFFGLFWNLAFLGGFTQRHKSVFSLGLYPQREQNWIFPCYLGFIAKMRRRKAFLFLLENDYPLWKKQYFLLETAPLAPIEVEILLLFSLKSKRLLPQFAITRLELIAGNSSLLKQITGLKNSRPNLMY
ncbi:hypothetical protein [Flavobacterium sp. 245]|uniref:hypothetical protein n=1 Tax=Flavobacterium sp. 245 TaxID=2512115 RepID=UPI00105E3BE8|nr:hypothetical protein [Flavobacterium sp. 245]TDO94519.1 hypothetical protein EV145_1172 [Flavobacterium sp. 245]